MKVHQLIEMLSKFDPELEVAILDGSNGGGEPRTINLGPCLVSGSETRLYDVEDLDIKQGEEFVKLGYGCY